MRFQILLTLILYTTSLNYYCSSNCYSNIGPCWGASFKDCVVCAEEIYQVRLAQSGSCNLLPQTQLLVNDTFADHTTLVNYNTSNPSQILCGIYTLSGKYGKNDFIQKNITDIPLNHWSLVIRLSIGFMGLWTDSQYLLLTITTQNQTEQFQFSSFCVYPDAIYSLSAIDCILTKQIKLTHNQSFASLAITAINSIGDPLKKFWGVKDLVVAAKLCHPYCSKCFGTKSSQCITCADGYYLQGNLCQPACEYPRAMMVDLKQCVYACPPRYYSVQTSLGKQCRNCLTNCMICLDSQTCQVWDFDKIQLKNVWRDKQPFWILIILILAIGCIAAGVILYKKITSKKNKVGLQIGEKYPSIHDNMGNNLSFQEDYKKQQPPQLQETFQLQQIIKNQIEFENLQVNKLQGLQKHIEGSHNVKQKIESSLDKPKTLKKSKKRLIPNSNETEENMQHQ